MDWVPPGDTSSSGGGNNIQGGGNQNQGGGRENEDEDAASGGGGGGSRNHNGHVGEKGGGGGGNMNHMGPMDSSEAESSDTSVDELSRDEMGSRNAYLHQYARSQPAINYAPAPVMQPYPVVNSDVHFFGGEKTRGCSIM
ncbi:hypothetical protein CK203_100487 [Vitis vinifera]|uniref:Uncharacterized protein n=1 Tax=Vitis vinifera TaxID=29760 RepID=A0A438EZW9_VITVI|nr:hypothetical protein CK203_100487 [Vitis vinifera]